MPHLTQHFQALPKICEQSFCTTLGKEGPGSLHGPACKLMQVNLMEPLLQEKYNSLKRIIVQAGSTIVSFSRGVDSAFLLKMCVDLLGDKALASTTKSETFPARELEEAKDLARQIGGKHIIIDSKELELPGFQDNPPHRCFLCKTELLSKINEIARQHGIHWVFDGSNADYPDDFRPGRLAAHRLGIRSPLE